MRSRSPRQYTAIKSRFASCEKQKRVTVTKITRGLGGPPISQLPLSILRLLAYSRCGPTVQPCARVTAGGFGVRALGVQGGPRWPDGALGGCGPLPEPGLVEVDKLRLQGPFCPVFPLVAAP